MRQFLLFAFVFLISSAGFSQNGKVKGKVIDAITNETVIGASVVYAPGKGALTDFDGNFSIDIPNGEYTITVSYVGYKPENKKVTINNNTVTLQFALQTITLNEVQVVADIAIARETPVAFTNVPTLKIQEQLGAQDLPMILNTTPGVYATQQGGGDGDARISIRGFNSQNVMVLIDGVPMNDMVNGRVYWSNWFGLDNITKGVQIQRGLGASKLAIPAIGGTMNILTAGIENKKAIIVKQEFGNNYNMRTILSLSSGRLENGWGFTAAGSFRRNDGWVDQLYSKMFFYYLKAEKMIGNHTLSLSAFGAPQVSGQRNFRIPMPVSTYSKEEAWKLGIDTAGTTERGRRYNPSWGNLKRTRENPEAAEEIINTSLNEFHKPVISLKDFWAVNEKLYISNILYASFGTGGGTQPQNTMPLDSLGQQSIQNIYNGNAFSTIITQPVPGQRISTNYIRKNYNEHNWYGALSTFNYEIVKRLDLSGGIDLRTYQGRVYSKLHDLLGGDYIYSNFNPNEPNNAIKKQGDVFIQNIHRNVRWAGIFTMLEYKAGNWSGFINLSSAISGYQQANYFLKRQLVLADTTLLIGYNDLITHNGATYDRNSPGLTDNQTGWKYLPGYTIKGGMNYNLTEKQNVFFNLGYLSRAPMIGFVFRNDNKPFKEVHNELIKSAEIGHSFASSKFSTNLNLYYTIWNNKPTTASFTVNGDPVSTTATGMKALHAGAEFDFIYKVLPNLSAEGMVSLGDWTWTSVATATIVDNNGGIVAEQRFDPRGVKVGDAAQNSFGASFRYEPVKRLYIKPQYTYFTKNYANFNPENLVITNLVTGYGPNVGRQSWRMPDYGLLDINCGYGFMVNKTRLDVRASVLNVFDSFYISDAQNNQFGNTFNAASASVNVGLGRRWITSLTVTF